MTPVFEVLYEIHAEAVARLERNPHDKYCIGYKAGIEHVINTFTILNGGRD